MQETSRGNVKGIRDVVTMNLLPPKKEEPMRVPRIAINGFGRIGRTVMRIAKMRRQFNVVAINDLSAPEQLAYSFIRQLAEMDGMSSDFGG